MEERRPRTLKHGDTFGVFDHSGNVLSGTGSPEGLYHRDTRHLSHFALSFGGMRPLHERIALRNYGDRRQRLTLTLEFAADFADLFEVRGFRRKQRGKIAPAAVGTDGVTLSYEGLDGRLRETRLRFDPPPTRIQADRAEFELELRPGGRAVLFVEVRCESPPEARAPRKPRRV